MDNSIKPVHVAHMVPAPPSQAEIERAKLRASVVDVCEDLAAHVDHVHARLETIETRWHERFHRWLGKVWAWLSA